MSLEEFFAAAERIKAEQYFQEKAASAKGLSAVDSILHRMQDAAEDPELLKVAAEYCPEATLEYYEKVLGGTVKVAEPPPPKGISAKTWDKILQKGPKTDLKTE